MYDTGIAMHKCSHCQGMGLERGEQERLLPQAQELLGALQCLFREAGTASSQRPQFTQGEVMSQSKEALFNAFVQWVTQHGWGIVYTRDPRQAVPSDCAFIRVRCPGEVLFTSVGLVQFRTPEEGVTACQRFAEGSTEPCAWQMNFPRTSPQTFASSTFAEAHALAQSRWYRWKSALRAWWPTGSRSGSKADRMTVPKGLTETA